MTPAWKSCACLLACAGGLAVRAVTVECGLDDKAARFAANELAQYLKDVKGRVSIVEDAGLKSQEWHIKAGDGNVTISGCDGMGAAYGVYAFLEKHLGFRWYAPDTAKTPVLGNDVLATLVIDELGRPAILGREMYVGGDTIDGKWRLRNKETARAAFGVGVSVGSPRDCHTFTWYNNAIGAKDNPAILGVNAKGKPTGLFCPSNPESRRLVAEQMKKAIRSDRDKCKEQGLPRYAWPTIYELSQDDGGGESDSCMCPRCKAIFDSSGSWSGVNIAFASAVAELVADEFPDVIVRTFAYSYTEIPPTNDFRAVENLSVRYCRSFVFQPLVADNFNGEMMKGWDEHVGCKHVWGYWRSFSGPLYPMVKPRKDIAAEMKFCRDMHVHGYFAQNEAPLSRSFSMMQHWLFLKLAENPNQDVNALANEFISAYYGSAAEPIAKYLDYLERRELDNFAKVDQMSIEGVNSGHLAQYLYRDYLDVEFFIKADEWLEEAERLAVSEPVSLRHVRLERLVVDRTIRDMYISLVKAGYAPDMKAAAERTAVALPNIVNNWSFRGAQLAERMIAVEREIKAAGKYPIALPAEIEGKDAIQWQLLSRGFAANVSVEDADSATGYASVFPAARQKLGPPFFAGAWNGIVKNGCELKLEASEIPQDEKFHAFKLGETKMACPGYFYFNSWHYRVWMQTLGIEPEMREVWLSVKFTGPNFVKGSTKPNQILYERIFFVKP